MTERYDIIDIQTGSVVASRKKRLDATRLADKKDLEYGAVRYVVKPIWSK